MKRIDSVAAFGRVLGIGLGGLFSKQALDELSKTNIPVVGVTVMFVVVIIAASKLLEIICVEGMERFRWLRKLVCGREYIEGHWIEYTDLDGGFYSLVTIQYWRGKLKIHGDSYSPQYMRIYSWDSVLSSYDGAKLDCTLLCTDIRPGSPMKVYFGYSTQTFQHPLVTKAPTSYTGTMVDFESSHETNILEGFKIPDNVANDARNDPSALRDLVEKYYIRMKQEEAADVAARRNSGGKQN